MAKKRSELSYPERRIKAAQGLQTIAVNLLNLDWNPGKEMVMVFRMVDPKELKEKKDEYDKIEEKADFVIKNIECYYHRKELESIDEEILKKHCAFALNTEKETNNCNLNLCPLFPDNPRDTTWITKEGDSRLAKIKLLANALEGLKNSYKESLNSNKELIQELDKVKELVKKKLMKNE